MASKITLSPLVVEGGEEDDDGYLESKDCVEHLVHALHHVAYFVRRLLQVLEDLCIFTGVYNDSNKVLGISYEGSS